ncbi:GNAT family N-acetyltransferase [Dickeya chrysanthemi]|uniref:GNAT family N-acetyltransferase n=1 Tax=Dickeya chrysanthemi TaxID=556 RepID=UPI0030193F73
MSKISRQEPLVVRLDDLTGEATKALVALHLAGMHENSPPDQVFALDLSGLQAPDMTFWSVWRGEQIAGIGALKMLPNGNGELKSMRTHPQCLRQGVAAHLLVHIVDEARRRGLQRLSLETGRGPAFEPALALYRQHGFVNGEAFAEYDASEFNQFLHLSL